MKRIGNPISNNLKRLSIILILAIILVPNVFISSMVSADSPPSGLISQWSAEGNASDSIDGNNGTLRNGVTYTAGKVGQAFSFDGNYACVEIPSNPSVMPATLTVEAWVKPERTGLRESIVSKWGYFQEASYSLELENNQFIFYLHDGTTTEYLWGGPVVTSGTWYHVAGTYDGTYARLYVNHNLVVGPTQTVAPMTDSSTPLRIGASSNISPAYDIYAPFQGLVDEVRLWNCALDASQMVSVASTVVYNPNTLNLKSKGGDKSFTSYLELPAGYDVNQINVSSVKLEVNGTQIAAQISPTSVGDYDGDKVPDRMVKFDRQKIVNALAGKTGDISLTVYGQLNGTQMFIGSDIIKVTNPGK